jgi:hypothetical protein
MAKIERKMNASRICDAIAAIGYSASSAIMDIVDNSVAYGGRSIKIEIILLEDKSYADRTNVTSIRIFDDGDGMSQHECLAALDIGSEQIYPNNSLSKFGFGLKSAGFSLGPKISIVSKKDGKYTTLISVDKRLLKHEYLIDVEKKGQLLEVAHTSLVGNSGTIVEISGCEIKNHDSAKKTIDALADKLGVTYCYYLSRNVNPISITLICAGRPDVLVTPKDILHRDKCITSYDADAYDCKTPILRKEIEIPVSVDLNVPKIALEVVLFPPNKAHSLPDLSEAERAIIKSYDVSRKNKGFFIYRNERLIRWGDDLDGLIGKDELTIRARIKLTSAHDDLMHVDVSKQRLFIPEEIKELIEREMRLPLREIDQVTKRFNELNVADEGQPFNVRNQDLLPEDDVVPQSAAEKIEAKKRKTELSGKTKEKLIEQGEIPTELAPVTDNAIPLFEKVRYSDKVGLTLWEMGEDATEGTFVRINTNHNFYKSILSKLSEDSAERQSIEALLWCAAAGEALTIQNTQNIDVSHIEQVLLRFKKVLSANLDSWCGNNQDLF